MLKENRLKQARELVAYLEAGEQDQADAVIKSLADGSDVEGGLYNEVGRLTRSLHDSINDFMREGDLAELAHVEMPDASERLRYVITMTEQAANTTLGAIEESLPLIAGIEDRFKKLHVNWQMISSQGDENHQVLEKDLDKYWTQVRDDTQELHDKLTEVLTAQSFQDLTSQIIRKVIGLVQDVEEKLIELVKISGHKTVPPTQKAANSELEGPAVPGVTHGKVMSDQDDVDELLSGLGF